MIDNESEITLLPTAKTIGKFQDGSEELNEKCEVGSTALVCETGEAYILSPSNVWKNCEVIVYGYTNLSRCKEPFKQIT